MNHVETEKAWNHIRHGEWRNLELMLEAGFPVNAVWRERSLLHWAIQWNEGDAVVLLLRCKADPNILDECGFGPLQQAAADGLSWRLRDLVEAGAMVDQSANDGSTPLHSAASYGHARCVSILLELGANPHKLTNGGDTPLTLAKLYSRSDVVNILLPRGGGTAE